MADNSAATAAAPNPIDAPGTDELAWLRWPGLARLPALNVQDWASAVIIAAHPDDEVLGAGGIIAILAAAGARLRLVAVTDGAGSHPGIADPAGLARTRTAETAAALTALKADQIEVIRLGFPDTGLAAREDELTAILRELARGFGSCLAPWEHDVHPDHETVGRAALLASDQTLRYPIWAWHWALPGDPRLPWHQAVRVPLPTDITARKSAAIGCFTSQLTSRSQERGPVLAPGFVAHFTRAQEVLFR
jgi:LmbE family N-acetylglucosaminyl deacetylase